MQYLKHAAMFGLDARIALAIFGALSVISGAALFSAIEQTRVIQVVHTMEQMSKAVSNYMLKEGQDFSQDPVWTNNHFVIQLLKNHKSEPVWNGPYIEGMWPRTDVPSYNAGYSSSICNTLSCGWSVGNMTPAPLSGNNSALRFYPCKYATGCNYVILVNPSKLNFLSGSTLDQQLAFLKKVDNYVDNGDGALTGKFRWLFYAGGTAYSAIYLGPSMLNTSATS